MSQSQKNIQSFLPPSQSGAIEISVTQRASKTTLATEKSNVT